jgi:hypothetical protein
VAAAARTNDPWPRLGLWACSRTIIGPSLRKVKTLTKNHERENHGENQAKVYLHHSLQALAFRPNHQGIRLRTEGVPYPCALGLHALNLRSAAPPQGGAFFTDYSSLL